MPFSDVVIRVRFYAQNEHCAYCGKLLVMENRNTDKAGAWRAHPIDGNKRNGELSNCVCLCVDCHQKIGHPENCASERVDLRKMLKLIG